ncbi:MAG: hypothetical protein KIT79_12650 [Deltaproteobacteria bacterium]|nr:hypothetical protein [Deltaproteobacteria bacterium]
MPEKSANESSLGDQWIEILKTGTFVDAHGTKVTFTEADLKTIAERHGPEWYEAPIVLGHPKDNHPAYGWVDRLKVSGGRLLAKFRDVDSRFARWFREGKFRKKSVRVLKDAKGWFLAHVGYLGAVLPAVPGMADGDPEFAVPQTGTGASYDGPSGTAFDFEFGGDSAEDQMQEPEMTEAEKQKLIQDATAAASAEFAKTLKAKDDELADLRRKEKETADRLAKEAEVRARADAKDFSESLVREGKILPKFSPLLTELLAGLADTDTVELAKGDGAKETLPRRSAFKSFLRDVLGQGKKPNADLSKEVATKDSDPGDKAGKGKDGADLSTEQKLHKAVSKIRKEDPKISYGDALSLAMSQLQAAETEEDNSED